MQLGEDVVARVHPREHTGLDVVDWVAQAVERGAGEVLLTAVDQEGTRKGLDIELLRAGADPDFPAQAVREAAATLGSDRVSFAGCYWAYQPDRQEHADEVTSTFYSPDDSSSSGGGSSAGSSAGSAAPPAAAVSS